MQSKRSLSVVLTMMLVATVVALGGPGSAVAGPGALGSFAAPFSANGDFNANPPATIAESVRYPTAVSIATLPNGRLVYWNGLENLETAAFPLALDAGRVFLNSRTRLLNLSDPEHPLVPTPEDGGANDLFCADQRVLLDGTVMAAGGTIWTNDPVNLRPYTDPNGPGGTVELFGNPAARIYRFDASGGTWTQAESMHHGRWYPTLVTLPDGRLFVASGVGRLIYNDKATNVHETEIFDPFVVDASTGETVYDPVNGHWTDNGTGGAASLPLFARLHLLANGKILYAADGQTWAPFGQSYDEALWNFMKLYDPVANSWSDAGIPLSIPDAGALSGAASVLLPFVPNADGSYTTSRILQAGGVLGASPGAYIATNFSRIITVEGDQVSVAEGPDLANRRWYSSGVMGANGNVFLFNGADKDEVIMPDTETAVRQVESYNPSTNTWTALGSSARDRTYHNSAILLADGRMLVGGHSPINAGYGPGDNNTYHNASGGILANNLKDPSFEIFTPPYLLNDDGTARTDRPGISNVSGILQWGTDMPVGTPDASTIQKAMLVRLPATTHTTDADMRAIELRIVSRSSGTVTVHVPDNRAVATPGNYFLFLLQDLTGQGLTPSVGTVVRVGNEAVFNTP